MSGKRAVEKITYYPPSLRTPDDDPHEVDTPVCIEFTEGFAERVYEEVLDGWMNLTEAEFAQLRKAVNRAHRKIKVVRGQFDAPTDLMEKGSAL